MYMYVVFDNHPFVASSVNQLRHRYMEFLLKMFWKLIIYNKFSKHF
jgi:hypothetical protein